MWAYAKKIGKNGNFWYKIAPKGYINLSDFYNILLGVGSPRTAPSCQIFTAVALKMWPYGPKIAKLAKFAHREKFWGARGKLEYRCTTTNLTLCNDTITVLKIILLHSVFVITNFVIQKLDKKTDKKITLFVYSRRATQDPHHTWHVIEEVRLIFAPLPSNFF